MDVQHIGRLTLVSPFSQSYRGSFVLDRQGKAHKRSLNSADGVGGEDANGADPNAISHRRRAALSVLQGIRRHYASIVDLISYVGLGLVLYAGESLSRQSEHAKLYTRHTKVKSRLPVYSLRRLAVRQHWKTDLAPCGPLLQSHRYFCNICGFDFAERPLVVHAFSLSLITSTSPSSMSSDSEVPYNTGPDIIISRPVQPALLLTSSSALSFIAPFRKLQA